MLIGAHFSFKRVRFERGSRVSVDFIDHEHHNAQTAPVPCSDAFIYRIVRVKRVGPDEYSEATGHAS